MAIKNASKYREVRQLADSIIRWQEWEAQPMKQMLNSARK
ncbi:hypothetical protein [Mucilaginibacter pedocola]